MVSRQVSVNLSTARLVRKQPDFPGHLQPAFDGFCPLGPAIVSTRALPDPSMLKLSTHVNGVIKQDDSADQMIWPIAQ